MKNVYESPTLELERFVFADILTASGDGNRNLAEDADWYDDPFGDR